MMQTSSAEADERIPEQTDQAVKDFMHFNFYVIFLLVVFGVEYCNFFLFSTTSVVV